jgi:hypothetical protein
MGGSSDANTPKIEVPSQYFGTVYSVIAARRTAFDTLMWQVPTLGLAAQAFLLTIAYGSNSSQLGRCISGSLAAVVALVAIQTMLKHRANEKTDNLILKAMEVAAEISVGPAGNPHDAPAVRARAVGNDLIENRLTQGRSARLWVASPLLLRDSRLGGIGAGPRQPIRPLRLNDLNRALSPGR